MVIEGCTRVDDSGVNLQLTVDGETILVPKEGVTLKENENGHLFLNTEAHGSYRIDESIMVAPSGTIDAIKTAIDGYLSTTPGAIPQVLPHFDSDGDNSVQTIKASAGKLHKLNVQNPNSADAWVQLFDEEGSITVGTTTPVYALFVPANGAAVDDHPNGLTFLNSIKYACTTEATNNTDPSTGLVISGGFE